MIIFAPYFRQNENKTNNNSMKNKTSNHQWLSRTAGNLLTLLLLIVAGNAWGQNWNGQGTEQDPYLINSYNDWLLLKQQVEAGNSFSGKVFRQTSNIDTDGEMVGQTEDKFFSGTYDGDGHTLLFNVGAGKAGDAHLAPFFCAKGATFRHISVYGQI